MRLLACVSLVVLLAAGCGEQEPLSSAEYGHRASEACLQAQRDVAGIPRTYDWDRARAIVPQVERVARAAAERLDALTPPASVAAGHARVVAGLRRFTAVGPDVEGALRDHDAGGVRHLATEVRSQARLLIDGGVPTESCAFVLDAMPDVLLALPYGEDIQRLDDRIAASFKLVRENAGARALQSAGRRVEAAADVFEMTQRPAGAAEQHAGLAMAARAWGLRLQRDDAGRVPPYVESARRLRRALTGLRAGLES